MFGVIIFLKKLVGRDHSFLNFFKGGTLKDSFGIFGVETFFCNCSSFYVF